MPKGIYNVPKAFNEVVKSYAPGSTERKEVLATFTKMYNERSRRERMVTPYSVFLRIKGTEIYNKVRSNSLKRPKNSEIRIEYKKEWDSLSLSEKKVYEDTAISMGYIKPTLNLDPRRTFIDRQLNKINKK